MEQDAILHDDDSITILRLARDCTESLFPLDDLSSRLDRASIFTQDTTGLSCEFDFDNQVLGSRVYRAATMSNVRTLTRQANGVHHNGSTNIVPNVANAQESERGPDVNDPIQKSRETYNWLPDLRPSITDPGHTRNAPSLRSELASEDSQNALILKREKTLAVLPESIHYPKVTGEGTSKRTGQRTARLAKVPMFRRLALPPTLVERFRNRREQSLALARDEAIEVELSRLEEKPEENTKVLLLGSSESGKSTLLKSMKLWFEGDFTEEERHSFKEAIFSNVVLSMKTLLDAMENREMELDCMEHEQHAGVIWSQAILKECENLPEAVHTAIRVLWSDSGVREAYRRRNEFQLLDSVEYYAGDIGRLAASNYIPSNRDVLMSRITTAGITEHIFETRTSLHESSEVWRVFDVGGARPRRTKWVHVSQGTHLIVFTVDLTCYDKRLSEDPHMNRMLEALTLFDSIYNSKWFDKAAFVLLFTKSDKLSSQMKESSPRDCFADLADDCTPAQYRGKLSTVSCNIF